jgi:hypothetical protein
LINIVFMQENKFSSKGVELIWLRIYKNKELIFSESIPRWRLLCLELAPTSSPLWYKYNNKFLYLTQIWMFITMYILVDNWGYFVSTIHFQLKNVENVVLPYKHYHIYIYMGNIFGSIWAIYEFIINKQYMQ